MAECYTNDVKSASSSRHFFDVFVAISQPSQWLYTTAPFLLGALAGMTKLSSLWRADFLVLLLFFLWPANFLTHGLQAWFHPEWARAQRQAVWSQTALVVPPRLLGIGLLVVGVLFSWLILLLAPGPAFTLLLWFCLVCLGFLPPFRWQTRFFLDIYGSAFTVLPAAVGFWWATLEPPSITVMVALGLWAAGWRMLFDLMLPPGKTVSGTVAKLGESHSLFFLFIHWVLFAVLLQGRGWWSTLAFLYPAFALVLMLQPKNFVRTASRTLYLGQGIVLLFLILVLFWNILL